MKHVSTKYAEEYYILTLFGLMKEDIVPEGVKCIEFLFWNYLVSGKTFQELVGINMLDELRNNRVCTIYPAEVLKTIFDDCICKSVNSMS